MRQVEDLQSECLENCLVTQALSGLCVGLILTNGAGKVVWLNRTAERVLGAPGETCRGQPLPALLKDLRLASFWQEAGQADGNVMGDVTVQWPERLSLKVNATRYVDDDGREIGRALLFCDVTSECNIRVELTNEVAQRLLDLTARSEVPPPETALTAQELRVLRLLGTGQRNEEMAETLGVATSTIRSHLKKVYRKLGVTSRAAAVSQAVRRHLA
ncbi:MAG: LuxR C-terminal-related transcriptional regulator [Phycisphaerae bacterium]|jgi:DNA-binding CsgD family transcriptional regulator